MYKMEVFKVGAAIPEVTFTDQKLGREYLASIKEKRAVKEWFLHSNKIEEFTTNDGILIPYLGEEQCYWMTGDVQCLNVGLFASGYCDDCQSNRNLIGGSFHPPYEKMMTLRGDNYPMSSIEYWHYNKNGTKNFAGLVYHVTGTSVERTGSGTAHLRKKKYGG